MFSKKNIRLEKYWIQNCYVAYFYFFKYGKQTKNSNFSIYRKLIFEGAKSLKNPPEFLKKKKKTV